MVHHNYAATSKAVVIYSGGLDSFTLLHHLFREGYTLHALSFNYGQRHAERELTCAQTVCTQLNISQEIADITSIFSLIKGRSSLMCKEVTVPHGHYAAENMKSTVVPNRNMILLSIATGYALSIGATEVFYGAHGGDHHIYPDCRPAFLDAMNHATALCDWEKIMIQAPYIHLSKKDILAKGLSMNLSYENTWTCYQGDKKACGKCGACTERLEAFKLCNAKDPIEYL